MNYDLFNNFFDKVYVLTLKRATDRHLKFAKELEGLNYTVFYGKDKNEFDIETLKDTGAYDERLAKKYERYSRGLTPGMLGCAWSHQLIYEDIIKNGFKKALILEDDIVINKENWKLLPEIFVELPEDWELVYLGFAKNEKPPALALFKKAFYHLVKIFNGIKFSHTTINNLYPKKISEHIYKSGYHDCTHAYGVTTAGAEKLLKLQTPICFYPDNLLAHAATNDIIKSYTIMPKIIDQEYQVGLSSKSYVNH